MPLYLTTSRIPELAELTLTQRRQLLSAALRVMKTKRPVVASLPLLLAIPGVIVGMHVGAHSVPRFLDSPSTIEALTSVVWMVTSYIGSTLGFLIGWFLGQTITFATARPYLREVIDRAIANMSSSS
jgi:hypothetical protein